jgi:hypothetical protein
MQSVNLRIIVELQQLSSETPELSNVVIPATGIYTAIRVNCGELFGHNYTVEIFEGGKDNLVRRLLMAITDAEILNYSADSVKRRFSDMKSQISTFEFSSKVFAVSSEKLSAEELKLTKKILSNEV